MEPRQTEEQPSLPIHFQLSEIWQRVLNVPVRSTTADFFQLGGERPQVAHMLAEVRRATGKTVAEADFLADPTIKGLTRCLLRDSNASSLFVPVQPGAGGPPFYFFHGDILGAGFYSKRLAGLLGEDQSFHISPPIQLGQEKLPVVEEIAARKRRALRRVQPHGPYFLGGFCVGAVVAYEVARQLEAEGEEVRTVCLIEPEIGDALARSHQKIVNRIAARRRPIGEKVDVFMRGLRKVERLRSVIHAPLREKAAFVVKNTKKLVCHTDEADARGMPADHLAVDGETAWPLAAYQWVLTSYIPRRYHGRVTMLLTEQQLEEAPFILKQWRNAAPHLRVEQIPGNHMSCITTHLQEIAAKLRAEINAVKSFAMMLMPSVSWTFSIVD